MIVIAGSSTVLTEEEIAKMYNDEAAVTKKQFIEYKESKEQVPETQAELDNKLLDIEARMSRRRELVEAIDSQGVKRISAIELEEDYPEPFSGDLIKANVDPVEKACIFGNVSLINAMKSLGQSKQFSFIAACRFNKAQMDAITNISRAKNGFNSILVKTDKHVSEGVVSHVQQAFTEKTTKRWGLF